MNDRPGLPPWDLAPNASAQDVVEDLSDMLTVIMGNLEMLSRQPLPPRAVEQVARADLAAHRAGQILWRSMGLDAFPGGIIPP